MFPRTHLDLFSGIGGFALAAERTGWKTIGFSETEPYCCKILKRHWPNVPNYGDIRNVRTIPADLVTGGFPCQPYSVAGKRRGTGDDRALWPEMLRVIAESKPRWVLGENVAGIINMELDRVLSDLENLGYSAWPIVIPACAVDARHRRNRVWIMANTEMAGLERCDSTRNSCPDGRAAERNQDVADASRIGKREPTNEADSIATRGQAWHEPRRSGESVADSKSQQTGRIQQSPISSDAGTGSYRSRETATWAVEPVVGRVADGIPHRVDRLKGLGNAIVPQVAEVILAEMARLTL